MKGEEIVNKKRDAKPFELFNRTECDQVVARRAKMKMLWRRRTKIAALEKETSNGNSNINSISLRKNKNNRLPSTSMLRHKSRQASRATINTIESIDSATLQTLLIVTTTHLHTRGKGKTINTEIDYQCWNRTIYLILVQYQ